MPAAGILTRCPAPTPSLPADGARRVEDIVEFSTYLEREARRRTDPTYAERLAAQARRVREMRAEMARDLPLFASLNGAGVGHCHCCRAPYAGATIGGGAVVARIGPAPSPAAREIWLVTDLSVMGQLIDTLL